jgi:hypothetical protein
MHIVPSLDMDELREYFALFNKPELLDELLGFHWQICGCGFGARSRPAISATSG